MGVGGNAVCYACVAVGGLAGMEDMINLHELHESSLLHNLFERYRKKPEGHIYTYTGSILVAINPYTRISIYTTEYVKSYQVCRVAPVAN